MENVQLQVVAGVATITLNRPKALNALNLELARDLRKAAEIAEADDAIRCVVIRGAGGNFMAGGDVNLFYSRMENLEPGETAVPGELFDRVNGLIRVLRRMPKPVLSSVCGTVAGFGLSLMSASDLVIAAAGSKFVYSYDSVAINPDGGLSYFLPRTIGIKRTMEMFLLGGKCDSSKMLSMGALNWVVPDAELEDETAKISTRLATAPAMAMAYSKKLVNTSFNASLDDMLLLEEGGVHECSRTAGFHEGVRSFIEKKKP